MLRKVFIDLKQNGIAVNASQVLLSSEDGTFGLKNIKETDDPSDDEIVAADGTAPLNPSTGRYEYEFSVIIGEIYIVSWEIIANAGENPTYKTETIGPFYSVEAGQMASSQFKGKFQRGKKATFLLKITTLAGLPINAESISIQILTEKGVAVTLADSTPHNVSTGFYIYDWKILATQDVGTYYAVWDYVVDDIDRSEVQQFAVSAITSNQVFYGGRALDFRIALEHHLLCAQNIPVYFEQSRASGDNKKYEFSFGNWNQSPGIKIYRNQGLITSGYRIDYFRGTITFESVLLNQDIINVDYNFQWFTDDDLNRFLGNAVQTVNAYTPNSEYFLETIPDRFIPTVLYGATKDALRQLMFCLNFQEPAQIFGGQENAQKAIANFETLKKNYESDWENLLEQKKYGPYPKTRAVVTPEYTLPGGRSLAPDTKLLVAINEPYDVFSPNLYNIEGSNVYTTGTNTTVKVYTSTKELSVDVYTLEEVYHLFREGNRIEILSHNDITGNLIFSPINYVWDSGVKSVYELKTTNGYSILTSDEHLFFVNGSYIPLRDIKIGDEMITSDSHTIETPRVKSINLLKRKQKMYDLEIFGTANLFANGIKCHNSRWFRMLFKGGN